jgi:energy-coupling factor transporter transmembrane protein EcfT
MVRSIKMLSLNDVKGIAGSRFWSSSPWKWDNWVLNGWAIGMVLVIVVALIGILSNQSTPKSYIRYTIPQSVIEQGKSIDVVSNPWGVDTVNGYELSSSNPVRNGNGWEYAFIWTIVALLIILAIIFMIYTTIRDYKLRKYTERFLQLWVENKELPDM